MHATRRSTLLLALVLGSCFSPSPPSGALLCSAAGNCPNGYTCARGACYKNSELPEPGTCNLAGDCAAPVDPCQIAVCIAGLCKESPAPTGTNVPASAQTVGDCKKLVCDGKGGLQAETDTNDGTPDGNDCTDDLCDGPNPTMMHTNKAAGASCGSGGVCNGAGTCGVCAPNAKMCNGATPQSCDGSGQWQNGPPCPFVCTSGECTGVCVPTSLGCMLNVPQTCNASGQWVNGAACTNVCVAGACAGSCVPTTKQCSGKTPQTCNASGQFDSGADCPFVCNPATGMCTGVCTPNDHRCTGAGNLTPQTCDALGQWQGSTPCSFVCVPASATCTGVCSPTNKRCMGTVSQTCDANGAWQNTTTCPFVCTGAGNCTGSCVPTTKKCGGSAPQTCDGTGNFVSGAAYGGPSMVDVGGYCVDSTEVTRAQYDAFLGAGVLPSSRPSYCSNWNGSFTPSSGLPLTTNPTLPIAYVDWCDAEAFCAWAGKRLCGTISGGGGDYNNVTAAGDQWYQACSSGGVNIYPYGNTFSSSTCRGGTFGSPAAVASMAGCHAPNSPYSALFDMSGNIYEWSDACTGHSGNGDFCQLRGGSFARADVSLVCNAASPSQVINATSDFGIRCCSLP